MSWTDPVSEAQSVTITKLYTEIDPTHGAERARDYLATRPTRRDASNRIDSLIIEARAKRARAAEPAPVPAKRPELVYPEPGYYAVYFERSLRFYRVKEGKGYYAGRFFLDRFKSDELMAISYAERREVLDLINANPAEAQMRFAKELTRCFCCGRMLTDEISRLRGIGPDCFGRRQDRDALGMTALTDAR